MPFTVIGYFVVCPLLAVLCEYNFKKNSEIALKKLSGSGSLKLRDCFWVAGKTHISDYCPVKSPGRSGNPVTPRERSNW